MTPILILAFIIMLVLLSKYEDYKKPHPCSEYLTGRIKRLKTPKGEVIMVEHYKGLRKFYKVATFKEKNYIRILKNRVRK